MLIDVCIGDPKLLYQRVTHPVVAIGFVISRLERILYRATAGAKAQFLLGTLASLITVSLVTGLAWATTLLLPDSWLGLLIEAALASTLLAARSLYEHVDEVRQGLSESLEAGRSAVAMIVGRDPQQLDGSGVSRAAIESAAENFSDGFVAPMMAFAVAGLPGIAAYKAINTLDSMIGHHNERYEYYGKFAARLDDVANWLPARLTAMSVLAAAMLAPNAQAARAFETIFRDAGKHRSPNAGWCEAAVAGALGYALAGPRAYGDTVVDDAWMGKGRTNLGPADISNTLRLLLTTWVLLFVLVTVSIGG